MKIIEIAIAIMFIYLIFSLFATVIHEIIATLFKLRAKNLSKAISRMLDDNDKEMISESFFEHPMIKYFGKNNRFKKPSYIATQTFSKVVIDIIKTGKDLKLLGEKTTDTIHNLKNQLKDSDFPEETKALLLSFAADAEYDLSKFKFNLESWFDEAMERTKGWYNRQARIISIVLGLLIAIIFNADSISIISQLSRDNDKRIKLAAMSQEYISKYDSYKSLYSAKASADSLKIANDDSLFFNKISTLNSKVDSIITNEIGNIDNVLGIGWIKENRIVNAYPETKYGWAVIMRGIGWLLTALAISLGAPFWFDILNKVIKIKGTGNQVPVKKE
ncbi:MAG: hypothetical protein JEY94_08060 [Melioribacteraceae bacterium]|nr:hypothetical protein [Melioribacteraceae bacterium]